MEDIDNPEIACVFNSDEVAERVESEMQRKKLSECLSMLTDDERELIEALFYYGLTERESQLPQNRDQRKELLELSLQEPRGKKL